MKLIKNINKNCLKSFFNTLISYINKYKYILYLVLPLYLLDVITRIFGKNIKFYKIYYLTPNLFTIIWILLIVGLTLTFKKKIGKKIYLISSIIFSIAFLTNNIYYSMTNTFFDFNLLESTSEGIPYILDAIKNCNVLVYISFIIIIFLIFEGYKKIPYKTKNNPKLILIIITTFIIIHQITPMFLGKANQQLTWSSWKNPRNIYISFNDNNKSLKISGLYEYTVRNFYITYLKKEKDNNTESIDFLNQAFIKENKQTNKYTGIFKGKNLILVQLEGIDNWLITKEDTPTLYKMKNESINFANHYSYYNGGGSTFNSEFAVNTGFITPLSYTQNAYTFNRNSFPYSMANIFKSMNYTVNAFHMNTGEYYSRNTNYTNWGYDKYYGLVDIENYKDYSYQLDRELILNEKFNNLIFNNDSSFVDYIITYSGHLPFTNTKGVCKQLYELDQKNIQLESQQENKQITEETIFVEMSEEECIRRQAKETDYMMELLLENLKEKELLNNTVIVVFTDHYLYTIEDKTILDKYKETSNNLINLTPFFIWSTDNIKANIKEPTSQLNILPTILNLFGVDYNPNNYIGTDALNSNYDGIVFFSDYSWYDGTVYIENGEITNNKSISQDKLEEKNYYISYITKKNDLALKYNYFKQLTSNKEK